MKKYIFGLLTIIFLFSGCTDEANIWQNADDTSENVKVTFAVDIPVYTLATRVTVANENYIGSLWLLVFDQKGNFIERVHSLRNTDAKDKVKMFDVSLQH